jgi:hypothetical protein
LLLLLFALAVILSEAKNPRILPGAPPIHPADPQIRVPHPSQFHREGWGIRDGSREPPSPPPPQNRHFDRSGQTRFSTHTANPTHAAPSPTEQGRIRVPKTSRAEGATGLPKACPPKKSTTHHPKKPVKPQTHLTQTKQTISQLPISSTESAKLSTAIKKAPGKTRGFRL